MAFKTDIAHRKDLISCVNPRAKRLSLRVDSHAGVIRLTIPPRCPNFLINRFINKNESWIAEKQKSLQPKIAIADGTVIPFMGEEYKIKIEHHSKRTTEITANNGILHIKTSRADPTTNLKRWMIEQAREAISPLSHEKAALINKKVDKIDLRDTKSRWGSCSTDKRLMFSWRLIMAPIEVIDYVVAHEVAHLKHMDHSKKFWDVCYQLTEGDADHARQWLKDKGNGLMRYF